MELELAERLDEIPEPAPSQHGFDWALVGWLVVLTLVHAGLAWHLPLAEDETYYWEWSRTLDWGYYDQGPMIAWVIRIFCTIFGETVWGIRAGAIACSAGWMVFSFLAVREHCGARAGRLAALSAGLTPLALVGGIVFTYDALQVLFWTIGIYGMVRALENGRGAAWWWMLVGIAVGLGLLSKLTMAFFFPCALLYLAFSSEHRNQLARPGPWAAAGLGLLLYLPAFLWQIHHNFVTLRHVATLSQATQSKPFYARVGDLVGSQAAVLGPVFFIVLLIALVWGWKWRKAKPGTGLFWCFSAPVLIYFFASAFRGKVLANWPGVGWVAAGFLAAIWALESPRRTKAFSWSLGLGVLITVPAFFPEIPAALGAPIPRDVALPVNRMYGGKELSAALGELRASEATLSGGEPWLAAADYQEASRIAFHTRGQPRPVGLFIETRPSQYALWNPQILPRGSTALLVLPHRMRDKQWPAVRAMFSDSDAPPIVLPIYRSGFGREPVRTYFIYRLRGFRPDAAGSFLKPDL